MDKLELEKAAPGFMRVYKSVRRLAIFHKLEQADCEGMALEAVVAHPDNIQAAIKMARAALNAERRQRRGGRRVDDRFDGGEGDEVEVDVDCRTLPMGLTLSQMDDEGEYRCDDHGDQDQDQASTDLSDVPDLPLVMPTDLVSTVIFLAWHGASVPQIAERTGVTQHRIRQILRDPPAVRQAIERAEAQGQLFPPPAPSEIRAAREPRHRHHKPRMPRAVTASLF